MNTCLVATDGSDHADHALEIASALALSHKCEIIVVHIINGDKAFSSMMEGIQVEFGDELEKRLSSVSRIDKDFQQMLGSSAMLSQHREISHVINTIYGEELLKRVEHQLYAQGHETVNTLLLEGDPAEQLIKHAIKHKAELVVLGCRGLGRIKGLFGSVSQQVAHELECRVVLVK